MIPSRPTTVSAATSALMIASSVDSMAASNRSIDDDVPDGADRVRAVAHRIVVHARAGRQPVAGREGDEEVAARVATGAAHPRDAEAGTLCQPLALVGEQRSVGREDHDDGAGAGRRSRPSGRVVPRAGDLAHRDGFADPHAVDAQPVALAVVRLDQGADREAADVRRRGRATPCRSRP